MLDASTGSSDERDAAKLAVLCIDTVLSVGDMTVYKVEPGARAFEREGLIDYLEKLVKPVAIDVQREAEGRVRLRIVPTKAPKVGPDVDPSTPRDMGEALRKRHGVDESALILVKGESGVPFTMRLAGLSLWDQSYRLHMGNWGSAAWDADEAARALGAVALLRIHRPGPGDVDISLISLH